MNKLNKAREMLINKYIEALEQEQIPWERTWYTSRPKNAISNTEYRGVNCLLLSFIAEERGYKGTRWCTFNQIADRDGRYHKGETWHLKQGSKSVPVEYWYVYNLVEKRKYSFKEYNEAIKADLSREKEFKLCSRTFLVFNEDCIEGITPEITQDNNIDSCETINTVIRNMGVGYEEGGDRAYYSPIRDTVVIPPINTFKTDYGYYATQLHELCHASGHQTRLNRNIKNTFGSEEYAKEELRAEISSSFLMQELNLEYDETHLDNHIAYIQSWIDALKNEPNELFRAIKDADEIVAYIEEKGEISQNKEQIQQLEDDYEMEM